MILIVGDRQYPSVSIDQLSLRHVLALQRELVLTNISSAKTFADVKALVEELSALPAAQREHAGQEVADILMYLTLLCSELGINMEQALEAKLADNERRFAV